MANAQVAGRSFGYQQTLMSGHYTQELSSAIKVKSSQLKLEAALEKKKDELERQMKLREKRLFRYAASVGSCVRKVVEKVGEEWVFLAVLGSIMAMLSYGMDLVIKYCQLARVWMYDGTAFSPGLQYVVWVAFPILFILFSAGFVHVVEPQSIGSGLPEMRVILGGIELKNFLTFRAMVAKAIGICASVGSGMPAGKTGPFVHIASVVATLMSKTFGVFRSIFESESRKNEMLAAACAVGVACTFAAPIGGVLFSIEVTSTYFAVRNYWRGFFSAAVAALVYRLLAIAGGDEGTLTAIYRTNLPSDYPFDAAEMIAFCLIGVLCGLIGALFVLTHRRIVYFVRARKGMSAFLQKYRLLYPFVVTLVISTLTCPLTLGQFMAGKNTFRTTIDHMFSNVTFTNPKHEYITYIHQDMIATWSHPSINLFVSLSLYIVNTFWMSALAITMAIPTGVFTPVFTMGAVLGRLIGEVMAVWFPDGINTGYGIYHVVPGGYAVVGAAAMSGAITHTISTAMIAFELTGQISHILPAVLAVLIANGIMQNLQPSIYDSLIQIKRLPYLPSYLPATSLAHSINAEDIMVRDVKYVSYAMTYDQLKSMLLDNPFIRSYPLVENPDSMVLLGSVDRNELIDALELHVGRDRRRSRDRGGNVVAEIIDEHLHSSPLLQQRGSSPAVGKRSRFTVTKVKGKEKGPTDSEEAERLLPMLNAGRKLPARALAAAKAAQAAAAAATNEAAANSSVVANGQRSCSLSLPKKSILKNGGVVVSAQSTITSSTTVLSLLPPLGGGSGSGAALSGLPQRRISSPAVPIFSTATSAAVDDTRKGKKSKSASLSKLLKAGSVPDIFEVDDEQLKWEEEQLKERLHFDEIHVDPAPFQLVEKTSLYRVHSIFSLLGLTHAYVTNVGRLVGVVSLKELRMAIASPSVLQDRVSSEPSSHARVTESATIGGDDKGEVITFKQHEQQQRANR